MTEMKMFLKNTVVIKVQDLMMIQTESIKYFIHILKRKITKIPNSEENYKRKVFKNWQTHQTDGQQLSHC